MKNSYFPSLIDELSTRSAGAAVSQLGFASDSLRKHLKDKFGQEFGEPGSFLSDLVFEATFGWTPSSDTLQGLSGKLIHPAVIDALDAPGTRNSKGFFPSPNYRLSRNSHPYLHQLAAWEILCAPNAQPKSLIVTSGTGSGKTECFMVPILNDLVSEAAKLSAAAGSDSVDPNALSQLVGVRALFLYPLNSLIQSQQERLSAWTGPFQDKVRFCLYNGNTPEKTKSDKAVAHPQEVHDRTTLRITPPPILVTNATMLEYMLVRSSDASIMAKSNKNGQGTLRWIVLDEAHSYIGSQAAELSLLLRRVLHGFGVDAKDVRFIATSATIGDPNGAAGQQLRKFISDLAGVDESFVELVSGHRQTPTLPKLETPKSSPPSLDQLELSLNPASASLISLYDQLVKHPTARGIRQAFTDSVPQVRSVQQVLEHLRPHIAPSMSRSDFLRWMDLLTLAKIPDRANSALQVPFLPVRLHVFHNVLAGLWACANPSCGHKAIASSDEWQFGKVFTQIRSHCDCGSPVYEMRSCHECRKVHLWAHEVVDPSTKEAHLRPATELAPDDFHLDIPDSDEDSEAHDLGDPDVIDVLVTNQCAPGASERRVIELSSMRVLKPNEDGLHLVVSVAAGCPYCEAGKTLGKRAFSTAFLSAPFFLKHIAPTLLEYCPEGETPSDLPFSGRKMITFTDSRQGTARMAASLQQDAERNALRGIIYRHVTAAHSAGNAAPIAKLNEHIGTLEAVFRTGGEVASLVAGLLAEKKNELTALQAGGHVTFDDLVKHIANHEADVSHWAAQSYIQQDAFFGSSGGGRRLTELFVLREFIRRPRKANNLETMGLIALHYPTLKHCKPTQKVEQSCNFTAQEWESFLKICLDYFVRGATILVVEKELRNWLGAQYHPKTLVGPQSKPGANQVAWPQVKGSGREHRLVKVLAFALAYDVTRKIDEDKINTLLTEAFDQISTHVLTSSDKGFHLAPASVAFAPVTTAWFCPFTRKLLDCTIRQISPYQHAGPIAKACTKFAIPLPANLAPKHNGEDDRVERVRQWLSSCPEISALRDVGAWSDLSDKVVEGSRYYRTAEHSAQQTNQKLKTYEDDFKKGKVNLLSCSTTMEMGVDIGGISVVAMNNAPPHPANYLQRAGRAGRRSETRSIALTICKSNPHDQMVKSNPRWAFDTPLPAPLIKLDSQPIVQRHINSLLLSSYLGLADASRGSTSKEKLNVGWWMTSPTDSTPPPSQEFATWLLSINPDDPGTPPKKRAVSGLKMLIRRTCFDGSISLKSLLTLAADLSLSCLKTWSSERAVIDKLLAEVGKDASPPYLSALRHQLSRLTDEYLLRELSAKGFLPAYGFPTHITSFDTSNVAEFLAEKKTQERRADSKTDSDSGENGFRFRKLPSRDSTSALGEYSPGAKIVIDGRVYQSAGITLNWHAPASNEDVNEIQNIRTAWRCHKCGANGTASSAEPATHCLECGASIDRKHKLTYLEPAGFSVDFYGSVDNDITSQTFIPVEPPWINTNAPWVPLTNPNLGKMRSTPNGTAFFHTKGIHRSGYAICLACGRAESMSLPAQRQLGSAAPLMDNHKKLRGSRKDGEPCPGSAKEFSIKTHLQLGHELITDVLEIQLNDTLGKPLNDQKVAYSIAVALRGALGQMLGIELSEISCATKPLLLKSGEALAIVLYDQSASGYCTSVNHKLYEALDKARKILECHSGQCDMACQQCLIAYDTRFETSKLDRKAALAFLSNSWFSLLKPSLVDAFWGAANSQPEFMPFPPSLLQHWANPKTKELRIFFPSSPCDWQIAAWSFKKEIHQAAGLLRPPLRIILPATFAGTAPKATLRDLYALSCMDGVTVSSTNASLNVNGGLLLAQTIQDNVALTWATRDQVMATPGKEWGVSDSSIVIRGASTPIIPISTADERPRLEAAMMGSGTRRVEILNDLNGPIKSFGSKFLSKIITTTSQPLVPAGETLAEIKYEDRYLSSPLSAALALSFLRAIKATYGAAGKSLKVQVVNAELNLAETRNPFRVFHDWNHEGTRRDAMTQALSLLTPNPIIEIQPKSRLGHARCLTLTMESGLAVTVWLDQGFGFWKAIGSSRETSFNFQADARQQGAGLSNLALNIEGTGPAPTHLFIECSEP